MGFLHLKPLSASDAQRCRFGNFWNFFQTLQITSKVSFFWRCPALLGGIKCFSASDLLEKGKALSREAANRRKKRRVICRKGKNSDIEGAAHWRVLIKN